MTAAECVSGAVCDSASTWPSVPSDPAPSHLPVAVERVWDNLITLKRKLKWERSETTDLMHAAVHDKVGKAQNNNN